MSEYLNLNYLNIILMKMYCELKLENPLSYQKAVIALLGTALCTSKTEFNEISNL